MNNSNEYLFSNDYHNNRLSFSSTYEYYGLHGSIQKNNQKLDIYNITW